MRTLDSAYAVAAPDVVADVMDGEVVVVNLDSGAYFRLQGPATVAWEACVSGATLSATPAANHPGFEAFVDEILGHGLIRAVPAAASPVPSAAVPDGTLEVEVYTDLQELLALDPVHDVDTASGWPVAGSS